jgi:uncharacterized protein
MLTPASAASFLAQPRITVVGASDDKGNFGGTIYRALKAHGHDVVAVNPNAQLVDGDPCYPGLASVPGPLGGVLVMVKAADAVGLIRECLAFQVDHIWLFKGLGGPGAVSTEAIELCRQAHVNVVEGACPLMFLEPVGVPHRIHRRFRRLYGSLASAS